MKIYIKSESQMSALSKIANKARQEGFTAKVNRLHHCVDVYEDGRIVQQRYAQECGKAAQVKHRYNEVAPGTSDYERIDYNSTIRDYTSEDPYIKYISHTNR